MTKDEALKMAIEALDRVAEYLAGDEQCNFDIYKIDKAYLTCKEALERPTNMVAVPADQLEKMQQELKQLRDEHKKWQGFARRVS